MGGKSAMGGGRGAGKCSAGGWRVGDVRRGYGVQSPLRRLGVSAIFLLARVKSFRLNLVRKQQRRQKIGGPRRADQ